MRARRALRRTSGRRGYHPLLFVLVGLGAFAAYYSGEIGLGAALTVLALWMLLH